ncbi:MAG: hypothetical protein M0017_08830 [Desulfobacteraceae bacterium]|nr:hypothetical protein [Desulfobacteraceae bacterium]
MPGHTKTERRKHPRCRLSERAFVIVQSEPLKLGQLVDITPERVAFRYLADGEQVAAGHHRVDIMLTDRNVYLQELPVTMVAEREEEPLPFASTSTRVVAMAFGELSAEQRSQLHELLALEENC